MNFDGRSCHSCAITLSLVFLSAVGTPDKDSDDFAEDMSAEQQRLTASPPLPFKKSTGTGTVGLFHRSPPRIDAQMQTASFRSLVQSKSSQVNTKSSQVLYASYQLVAMSVLWFTTWLFYWMIRHY